MVEEMTRAPHRDIVLAAPVTIPYERYSIRAAHWWIGRALAETLRVAGLRPADIDGFACSSFSLGEDTAVGLTQHFGLCVRHLDFVPMGGASAIVALRHAARAVEAGDATICACVAGDTSAPDSFRQQLSAFSRFSTDAAYPYAGGGPNMSFALLTDAYMQAYGARKEDFGRICIAQRENAKQFPHALLRRRLTMEEYLGARLIADPIALFDCVMPCAGAEAFLVMREDVAKTLKIPFARLRATIERHNAFAGDPIQLRGGWAMDCAELYAMAGTTPDKVDLLETYDDYPVIVMLQFEDLGFCKKGEAPDFVRAHDLTVAGNFPHNTSGGQLSVGQAGAAGGHLGLVEAIRQLTGQALGAQVPDAKLGLVSGFGMINYDRGLCSGAAILAAT
jgi:acetyl-CoA acetyltransferase